MFNSYPYYNKYYNTRYNNINSFNPTFFKPSHKTNPSVKAITNTFIEDSKIKEDEENISLKEDTSELKNENKNTKRCTFPFSLQNDRLSLFGFEVAIDDLLILGIILILLLDSECNYALIIVLGLMFFNINLSSLNLF